MSYYPEEIISENKYNDCPPATLCPYCFQPCCGCELEDENIHARVDE